MCHIVDVSLVCCWIEVVLHRYETAKYYHLGGTDGCSCVMVRMFG